jgi:molecular chaperone DnaK
MASRIYGIDLGTTYSCISYVDETGRPVVVPNAEGDNTTPSVVYFESADNIIVGKEAKNSSKVFPDRVIAFVKREMGSPTFTFDVDGKSYRPEDVSSLILRKLAADAAAHVGEEVKDVVITCPAYFGINEREATKNAGKIAGLNVRHILNEPTAAAICYGAGKPQDKVVMVYDLGGGTFDVTVITIKGGDIQVVFTDGNHNLGGKDWDARLITYLAGEFTAQHPDKSSPLDTPESLQQLVLSSEDAKRALSTREKTNVLVSHDGAMARVELTAAKLEELTADLFEQTMGLTRKVIEQAAQRGAKKIDQLLLVGGSSRMPIVARRLKETFNIEPSLFEPDLAVAKGAALMGVRILAGEIIAEEIATKLGKDKDEIDLSKVDDKTLQEAADKAQRGSAAVFRLSSRQLLDLAKSKVVNVCSRGFGIEVTNHDRSSQVTHLIKSNTAVPIEVTETGFGLLEMGQRSVKIRVMEARATVESKVVDDNNEIGMGDIEGLPPGMAEGSPIHVTFRLAEDGTLDVAAREPSSGRDLRMTIKTSAIMNQEQVEASRNSLALKTVSG